MVNFGHILAAKNRMHNLYSKARKFREEADGVMGYLKSVEVEMVGSGICYCEYCNSLVRVSDTAIYSSPIFSNKCKDCEEDYRAAVNAKSNINSCGLSLYDVPDELLQLQKIICKTRIKIKTKKHDKKSKRVV